MEKHLVSIVLPVYNGEKYLKESINSVINQTYTNWELLILDDCSIDNSGEIAKEYEQKDNRIHYIKNEHNLRLPRNLNKGFSLAKGDFLTWTSDDNKYRPQAIEKMVKILSEKKADFVFASCRIINENGEEIEYIMVDSNSPNRIIGQNVVGACFMYSRRVYETIGEYNPELTLVEDYDYWQRVYTTFSAETISDILYDYRWHSGALTSTMRKDQFNEALEKMLLKNAPLFGKLDLLKKYYLFSALNHCREELKTKDNPYRLNYLIYKNLYFLLFRIPRKMKKIFK